MAPFVFGTARPSPPSTTNGSPRSPALRLSQPSHRRARACSGRGFLRRYVSNLSSRVRVVRAAERLLCRVLSSPTARRLTAFSRRRPRQAHTGRAAAPRPKLAHQVCALPFPARARKLRSFSALAALVLRRKPTQRTSPTAACNFLSHPPQRGSSPFYLNTFRACAAIAVLARALIGRAPPRASPPCALPSQMPTAIAFSCVKLAPADMATQLDACLNNGNCRREAGGA